MKAFMYRFEKLQLNVFLKFRRDIAFYEIKNGKYQRLLFDFLSTGKNTSKRSEIMKIFSGSMNFDFDGEIQWTFVGDILRKRRNDKMKENIFLGFLSLSFTF